MITKILILAAGRGERLGKLTENTPKPLLEIDMAKSSIIKRLHSQINNNFPTTPTYVNISYLAWNFLDHFSHMEFKDRPIFLFEPAKLGPACTVSNFIKDSNGDILILNGDLVLEDEEFSNLAKFLKSKQEQVIVCHKRKRKSARSEVILNDSFVKNIQENPHLDIGIETNPEIEVLVSSGIYKLNKESLLGYDCAEDEGLSPNLLNHSFKNEKTCIYNWNAWRFSVDSIATLEGARKKLNY